TVALPQLQDLSLERDEVGTPHLRGRFEHWRAKAGWQREDQFSDGTLRLMGLVWSITEGSGPLLLEEPELSSLPDVVRYIPQMLGRVARKKQRQIILTTRSPELLADEGIAPDEVILLFPSGEGTTARSANDEPQIVNMIQNGLSISDAVLPLVAPKQAERLGGFEA